jgi:hypothetical protein
MSILEKRVAALEAKKTAGRPAYVFVWEDDDQATVERAVARRRAEMPDASEIIAFSWGRPT